MAIFSLASVHNRLFDQVSRSFIKEQRTLLTKSKLDPVSYWTDPLYRRAVAFVAKSSNLALPSIHSQPTHLVMRHLNALDHENQTNGSLVSLQGVIADTRTEDWLQVEKSILWAKLSVRATQQSLNLPPPTAQRRALQGMPLFTYHSKFMGLQFDLATPAVGMLVNLPALLMCITDPLLGIAVMTVTTSMVVHSSMLTRMKQNNRFGTLGAQRVSKDWNTVFEEKTLEDSILCGMLLDFESKYGMIAPFNFLASTPTQAYEYLSTFLDHDGRIGQNQLPATARTELNEMALPSLIAPPTCSTENSGTYNPQSYADPEVADKMLRAVLQIDSQP